MGLNICGTEIQPSTRSFFRLKVVELLDGNDLSIPLHVINGSEDGPVLGVFACIHGSEYYQNRVVRRVVEEISPEKLRGTILAVPVANPLAFSHMTRQSPEPPEETVDFSNMNRVFPGKRSTPLFGSMEATDVSLTMRMAATLVEQVLSRCTCVLDLHGQRMGLSLKKMLYNRASAETMELARIFGLGLIHDPVGGSVGGTLTTCTDYAERLGIPGVAPEIGGGGHGETYEKQCEELGIQGVKNVMIHLNMLEGKLVLPDRQFYFRKAPHIRATQSGYFVSRMEPEDVGIGRSTRQVEKGEDLGTIYNPYTLREVERIVSPADGLLYACRVSGLIEAQNEILAVGEFEDARWIE